MEEKKKKNKVFTKLKHKYRLTVHNDSTLAEVLTFRLSRLNVFAFMGIFFILVAGLIVVLLFFTPLRMFLPTYTDSAMSSKIVENAIKVDSLEREIQIRDRYLTNIKNIIEGKELIDYQTTADTAVHYKNLDFKPSKEDSLLRKQIEEEEIFNLTASVKDEKSGNFKNLHFFAPLSKGMISRHFDIETKHYGLDIVAPPNEGVKAVLDGTVVSSTWTLATGYVIQLQHENDLVSFYKHNSALLRKVGDRVKAGEVIAIIGNSGELTTGPHLHFELWHKGIPVNPEDYIVF